MSDEPQALPVEMEMGVPAPAPVATGKPPSFLIVGPPGSGKTMLACSAPGKKYLIDLDAKAEEMVLLKPRIDSGEITIWEDNEPLLVESLLSRAIRIGAKAATSEEPQGYLTFCKLVNKLGAQGHDADVWIVDTLTRLGEHLGRYIAHVNKVPSMRPRDYGTFLKMMEEVIDKLRKAARARGKIFICTVHQKYLEEPQADMIVKHEGDGKEEKIGTANIRILPAIEGQIASKLAGYFSEVYVTHAKNRGGRMSYIAQTIPDEMSNARTSRTLPAFIHADLAAVLAGKAVAYQG